MNPSAAALAAGREVLSRIAGYLTAGGTFAVETTLSGKGTVELISKAKSRGYEIHLVLVWLDSPERCMARVRDRAAKGGHYIPDADVRRRYERGLANGSDSESTTIELQCLRKPSTSKHSAAR